MFRILLLLGGLMMPIIATSQTIIPTDFYGSNAWMPDSVGLVRYWGDLHDHWTDIQNSNVKLMRIGGIACDKDFFTDYQIINMIDSIRKIGAEPIVQVPLWGGNNTALEAADIVQYINVTKSKGVKYFAIGNEPNLIYNLDSYGFTPGGYTYSDYASDVKTFSIAMKTVDPTIKILAGDLAWYYTVWVDPLLTPGGADDITGNNGTHDYVDIFTFHAYPFQGNADQTRAAMLNYITNFEFILQALTNKSAAAEAYHTRNNPLGFAVTELNVAWREPASNETDGVGSKSFIAGQWWADMLLTNAKGGSSFVNFWSVVEGGASNPVTDHGYIDHDNETLRPTYHHFKLCSKYMTDTLFTTTDNQDSIKAYVTKNPEYGYSVLILNYDENDVFSMRLRLNTDAISGSETLQINADANLAKEITETIPANATVLMFLSPNGHYIGKYTYTQTDADNNEEPTFTVYQPTRAKKVFAHYLPWFDVDGQYNGGNRVGWCHEGDCTDANNKSSVYTPLIGEYSQFDEEVIKYHIRQAIAARIDGFLVNINPEWDFAWKLFHKICDAAIAVNAECINNDFKIAISYDNSTKTSVTDVMTLFELVRDSLYHHPDFSHLAWTDDATGKFVMTVWSEANWTNYRTAIDDVFGKDSIFAIGRNVINFDLFDGNMEWVGYLTNDQNNTTDWGEQSFEDSDWVMARQLDFNLQDIRSINPFKLGNAYPGFDDRNVPTFWNGGNDRYFARFVTTGEVMRLTWDKHINYTYKRLGGDFNISNNWIQLVTWNDFPEGTAIEPSEASDYGYLALQTNREKIAEFKGITTTGEDTVGVYVPFAIYQAIQENRTGDANTALTYFCNEEYSNAKIFAESGVLPVELLSFTGAYIGGKTQLDWEVGDRYNHAFFDIEHSTDGIHFKQIGREDRNLSNYQFIHEFPSQGLNYYRLKQVDFDEHFKYSKTITIDVPVAGLQVITYQRQVQILTQQAISNIDVYNALGQRIPFEKTGNTIHIGDDFTGVCWVRFEVDGVQNTQKVVISQ